MSTNPILISRDVCCGTRKTVTPSEPGTIFIPNGTYSSSSFTNAITSRSPSGPVVVKPTTPNGVIVTGGWVPFRQYMTLDGIIFDGQDVVANSWYPNITDFVLRNCTFKRFWMSDPTNHSEALYLGGGCSDGLIENCIFDDNGTTGHIFFTWFGGDGDPARICIRGCVFTNSHNPYFDIQFREEIPSSATIYISPDNQFQYGVQRQEFIRSCP
jgi:hypothetical protein